MFIIELDTGFCGYLPLTAALSVGAERCYKFEDKITEKDVLDHAKKLKKLMERDNRNILIIMFVALFRLHSFTICLITGIVSQTAKRRTGFRL